VDAVAVERGHDVVAPGAGARGGPPGEVEVQGERRGGAAQIPGAVEVAGRSGLAGERGGGDEKGDEGQQVGGHGVSSVWREGSLVGTASPPDQKQNVAISLLGPSRPPARRR